MRSKKTKKIKVIPLKKPRQVSLLAGLTGGYGTGKSTVARIFRSLGAHVIDSDRLAHQALKPGTPTYDAIRDHFGGKNILGKKGLIDRRKLAQIVFKHPGKRKTLEAIVHPYVFAEIQRLAKKKSGVLMLEVPLLFETNFNEKMDANIVARASEKTQAARLMKRDRVTPAEVRARVKVQMPLAKKCALADFVINNDGSIRETKKQVAAIWEKLLKLSSKEKKENS